MSNLDDNLVVRIGVMITQFHILLTKLVCTFKNRFRTGVKTKHSRSFDGVSSLRYEVILVKYKPLFTWIVVSVNQTLMNEVTLYFKLGILEYHNKALFTILTVILQKL